MTRDFSEVEEDAVLLFFIPTWDGGGGGVL